MQFDVTPNTIQLSATCAHHTNLKVSIATSSQINIATTPSSTPRPPLETMHACTYGPAQIYTHGAFL